MSSEDREVQARRSPALCQLPRREVGNVVHFQSAVLKLRISEHRGAKRKGVPQKFGQVTIPSDLLGFYDGECAFKLTVDLANGNLGLELVKGEWLGVAPPS